MIRKARIVSLFSIATVICLMLAFSAAAQRQTRLVFCNEGERTNDTIAFPGRTEVMGNQEFAPWEFTLSDNLGRYKLRVSSYQSFHPYIYTPDRNGKWAGRPVGTRLQTGKDRNRRMYYYWDLVDYFQKREPANPAKLLLMVKPSLTRQRITASWKTSDCEDSAGSSTSRSCYWRSKGLYGVGPPYHCECGGRRVTGAAATRACGAYPTRP